MRGMFQLTDIPIFSFLICGDTGMEVPNEYQWTGLHGNVMTGTDPENNPYSSVDLAFFEKAWNIREFFMFCFLK